MLRTKWPELLLLLVLGYLFIAQLQAIWPFTIDDMYITLRYSRHWSSGKGLLWNIHELPVEGYSNFLFVVLGTIALNLKLNPVIVLKFCGVFGLFFTCWFVYLLTRTWFRPRHALLPLVPLLLYKGQIIWTASGLETTVYQALICGGLYFLWRGIGYNLFPQARGKPRLKKLVCSVLLFLAAGLTRPEAPVLIIIFYLLAYFDSSLIKKQPYYQVITNYLLSTFLLFVLIYSCYFGWRWYYFGYLFPNPVYCKGIVDGSSGELVIRYGHLILPFLLLIVPACIHASDRRHFFLWLPSVAYGLMLWRADAIVAFDNRLFLPAFTLLLPLMLNGVFWYTSCICNVSKKRFWPTVDFLFLAVVLLFIPKMTLAEYRYFSENPQRGEALRFKVVEWIERNTIPGEQIVLADSGLIPYYSSRHFIDSYCLNNRSLAHDYPSHPYIHFCKKIIQERPEVIILTVLATDEKLIYTPADDCLKDLLAHKKDYRFVKNLQIQGNSHQSYIYQIYRLNK